jgi:general secretion pathway protein G
MIQGGTDMIRRLKYSRVQSASIGTRCIRPGRSPLGDHGFTLLELLVVVAIIALLASYVGPKYFSQVGKSEQSVAKSQIGAFSRALGAYRLDVGNFPSTEDGLNALLAKPSTAIKWNGPYLEGAVPMDPWGSAYEYKSPGAKGDFDITSYGKDRQPGGEGDAADLTSN